MPWTKAQNRLWRAAEHNPEIAREHGLSQSQAGKMAHEGIKHPMNPVMHTHHPWEDEVKAEGGLEYLKGGGKPGEPKKGKEMMPDRHSEGHHKSFRSEAKSLDSKQIKSGGMEKRSGYGNPQAGRTTLPGQEGGEGQPLGDETRGTHELPEHQYAAPHAVPQEMRERLARAMCRATNRR